MSMGFAPTWLRQVSPLLHKTTLSTAEVQYLGKGKKEFQILVDGQQIQQSDNFIYLGGNVSTEGQVEQMEISQEG